MKLTPCDYSVILAALYLTGIKNNARFARAGTVTAMGKCLYKTITPFILFSDLVGGKKSSLLTILVSERLYYIFKICFDQWRFNFEKLFNLFYLFL